MDYTERPRYLEVAGDLRAQIRSGELAEGQRLPSARSIEAQWQVSAQVARAALRLLKDEGLTEARHGMGTRVRRRPPIEVRDVTHGHPDDARIRAELAADGVVVDDVRDRVTARMPDTDDQERHRVAAQVPLIVVVREYLAGGNVVHSVESVWPADRSELLFPAKDSSAE